MRAYPARDANYRPGGCAGLDSPKHTLHMARSHVRLGCRHCSINQSVLTTLSGFFRFRQVSISDSLSKFSVSTRGVRANVIDTLNSSR